MEFFYLVGVGLIAYAINYYRNNRLKEPYLFDMKARKDLKRKCAYIFLGFSLSF